jgi:hypothetical protein
VNEYGLVANGELVESRLAEQPPTSGDWRPFKVSQPPQCNPDTEELAEVAPLVELDGITRRWTVLKRPTEAEIAAFMLLPKPPPVPGEVPMWAFRLALEKVGMLDSVLAFVQSLPHDAKREAETHLEYGNYIRRDHPLMAAAGQLGLDSAKVDDIFRVADELKDGVADFGEVAVGPENSAERTLWNRVRGWVTGLFGGG